MLLPAYGVNAIILYIYNNAHGALSTMTLSSRSSYILCLQDAFLTRGSALMAAVWTTDVVSLEHKENP